MILHEFSLCRADSRDLPDGFRVLQQSILIYER